MSKAMNMNLNMLRTRRRDNNVKPNRRLDRKSSRGMIYENEELRLKTININAEIERGQSDIKKLKRENDMLKKEIWCLRDEYEKLDKLLKEKDIDFSASSSTTCTSDSESTSSYTGESVEVETSQNIENVYKTNNMNTLQSNFDLLSIVPEENSTDYNSEKQSTEREVIKADQCYPLTVGSPPQITHFFSPLPCLKHQQNQLDLCSQYKSGADLLLKTDNNGFRQADNLSCKMTAVSSSSFSNGGNLEELLNDIENISHDILQLSNTSVNKLNQPDEEFKTDPQHKEGTTSSEDTKEYKSELSVVLMPKPMPLIGFEKYKLLQRSAEQVATPGFGLQDPWSNGHHRSCDNVQQFDMELGIGLASSPHRQEEGVICSPLSSNTRLNEQVQGSSTLVLPQIPDLPISTTDLSHPICNGDVKQITNNQPMKNQSPQQHARILHDETEMSSSGNLTSSNQQETIEDSVTHQHHKSDSGGAGSRLSGIRKKVSIHFRGRKERDKDKKKQQGVDGSVSATGNTEANNNNSGGNSNNNSVLMDNNNGQQVLVSNNRLTVVDAPTDAAKSNGVLPSPSTPTINPATPRVSISASPERRKQQRDRDARRHRRRHSHHRRSSAVSGLSGVLQPNNVERSFSVCSSSHNNNQQNQNAQHRGSDQRDRHLHPIVDDLLLYSMTGMGGSRSSSASSVSGRSVRLRRLSSNGGGAGAGGKLPWCACWGNGCL